MIWNHNCCTEYPGQTQGHHKWILQFFGRRHCFPICHQSTGSHDKNTVSPSMCSQESQRNLDTCLLVCPHRNWMLWKKMKTCWSTVNSVLLQVLAKLVWYVWLQAGSNWEITSSLTAFVILYASPVCSRLLQNVPGDVSVSCKPSNLFSVLDRKEISCSSSTLLQLGPLPSNSCQSQRCTEGGAVVPGPPPSTPPIDVNVIWCKYVTDQ